MTVEPVALAGHREVVVRDDDGRVRTPFRHPVLRLALDRGRAACSTRNWPRPLGASRRSSQDFKTTEGLAAIVAAAFERMEPAG